MIRAADSHDLFEQGDEGSERAESPLQQYRFVGQRLHEPLHSHEANRRMAFVFDLDLVNKVGDDRGPVLLGYQSEGQREDVRSLSLAFVLVRLGVEEPCVETRFHPAGQVSANQFGDEISERV